MIELLNALSVGGDVGIMAMLVMLYRIDKRLSWCEFKLGKE